MRGIEVSCRANPGFMPRYSTEGAAGADLKADIADEIVLRPGERRLVPTGLWLQVPPGFEAQVRPRSGLAIEHGITLLNSPGTVDSDYRGEVKVVVVNLGQRVFRIGRGDRIAQIVFSRVARAVFRRVGELDVTGRGQGGFGSTGVAE